MIIIHCFLVRLYLVVLLPSCEISTEHVEVSLNSIFTITSDAFGLL